MDTDNCRSSAGAAVGFHLLPNDLLHNIFLQLALPEIPRLRAVSKFIKSVTTDPSFLRNFNLKSSEASWFFVCPKKWGQYAFLKGFSYGLDRWFNFSMYDYLAGVVHRSDDLYFLTACGSIFLFSNNTRKELLAVNFLTKCVNKIQPSPLGPLDSSKLRRSGMKLMISRSGGWNHFRFFFVELVGYRPVIFEYDSLSGKWQQIEVDQSSSLLGDDLKQFHERPGGFIFLGIKDHLSDPAVVVMGLDKNTPPVVLRRPTFSHQVPQTVEEQELYRSIISRGHTLECRQICGDGVMLIIKTSSSIEENKTTGEKFIVRVELWCLSSNGNQWEMVSEIPQEMMKREVIRKPYGVIRGCIEKKNGTTLVRAVLVSNLEGSWDMVWLSYDVVVNGQWTWSTLPDCKMNGANMGGMSFSSGLTLS